MTQVLLVPKVAGIPESRLLGLLADLTFACQQTTGREISFWGAAVPKDFAVATMRRGGNLAGLLNKLLSGVAGESRRAANALVKRRLYEHVGDRAQDLRESFSGGIGKSQGFAKSIGHAIRTNPKESAVRLSTLVISSLLVSGGLDGDGGAPDLDLVFGIDAHRSVLSHSILMGAALEAGILAMLKLVRLTHKNLPAQHDPVWDELLRYADEIAQSAAQGVSIGMAYHLLADGLAQPAPYKDIPLSMPIEVHQAIFVVNATGEAVDVRQKADFRRRQVYGK